MCVCLCILVQLRDEGGLSQHNARRLVNADVYCYNVAVNQFSTRANMKIADTKIADADSLVVFLVLLISMNSIKSYVV